MNAIVGPISGVGARAFRGQGGFRAQVDEARDEFMRLQREALGQEHPVQRHPAVEGWVQNERLEVPMRRRPMPRKRRKSLQPPSKALRSVPCGRRRAR